jgi:hypothetical protein
MAVVIADFIEMRNPNFRKFFTEVSETYLSKNFCPDIYDKTMDTNYIKNRARTFNIKRLSQSLQCYSSYGATR